MSTPNYDVWLKTDLWEVGEAAQLIFRFEPSYLFDDRDNLAGYWDILSIAEKAVVIGTLKTYRNIEKHEHCESTLVWPRDFLIWAKSKGYEIPEELSPLLDGPEPPKQAEEELDPRERNSLLQIIAVLAAEAGVDLEKHSKTANILLEMGAMYGLKLPKDKDTIAKFLRKARDLQKTE